jgi:hypothetical protein
LDLPRLTGIASDSVMVAPNWEICHSWAGRHLHMRMTAGDTIPGWWAATCFDRRK